jgi:hypothetical protein
VKERALLVDPQLPDPRGVKEMPLITDLIDPKNIGRGRGRWKKGGRLPRVQRNKRKQKQCRRISPERRLH